MYTWSSLLVFTYVGTRGHAPLRFIVRKILPHYHDGREGSEGLFIVMDLSVSIPLALNRKIAASN